MDPRGGAEFDENGPNLTEGVFWALATTWLGVKVLKQYRVQDGIKHRREIGYNILVAQGSC